MSSEIRDIMVERIRNEINHFADALTVEEKKIMLAIAEDMAIESANSYPKDEIYGEGSWQGHLERKMQKMLSKVCDPGKWVDRAEGQYSANLAKQAMMEKAAKYLRDHPEVNPTWPRFFLGMCLGQMERDEEELKTIRECRVGILEKLRDAAYKLSTYTAAIHWDGSPNTRDFLEGLREHIEKVQVLCEEMDQQPSGMKTDGAVRYLDVPEQCEK